MHAYKTHDTACTCQYNLCRMFVRKKDAAIVKYNKSYSNKMTTK